MTVVCAALLAPAVAQAGKLTCLTGTDPSVANDAYQLALARAGFGAGFTNCPCANPLCRRMTTYHVERADASLTVRNAG